MIALLATLAPLGCVSHLSVPDTAAAIQAYTEALERGDAAALHEMFSEESKRGLDAGELKRVMTEQKSELSEHARSIALGHVVQAHADVRYRDGEVVTLSVEEGVFHIAAGDALPGAARSPSQALDQLRSVLARRSYAGLMRVLTPRSRAAAERDMQSIVDGLVEPTALDIDVVGDTATVTVPGGHLIRLRRKDGVWHVDDFN